MDAFRYENNRMQCENVPLDRIAADHGTPVYVYSQAMISDHYRQLDAALYDVPHIICYSVKTNSNLSVLSHMASMGSGFDIVSGGELYRVLRAGGDPSRIVFAGVGKTRDEFKSALEAGILMVNLESIPEARALSQVARDLNKTVKVALRINPDVDADTHHYISTGKKETKFGLPISRALEYFSEVKKLGPLDPVGVHCHIGSQITKTEPFEQALKVISPLVPDLRQAGFDIRYLNFGGGLGIVYENEIPASARAYAERMVPVIKKLGVTYLIEPGRFVVGNAGALITRVLYIKQAESKTFAIVDGAMNDLIRPTLYGAYHQILPVETRGPDKQAYDVVGPICESGDFFAKDRVIEELNEGDLIAIKSAGAYGFSMASNYNTRPRAAEVMVDGARARLIRRRESLDDLLSPELVCLEAEEEART